MRRSLSLKIVSIVMMLVSLVRLVFGLMMLNLFATASNMGAADEQMLRTALIAMALIIACAVAELVSGFLGALNWEEPLRSGRSVRWGTAALILGIAGNFVQSLTGYGVSYVAWTTGFIAPAVYLAAALHFHLRARKK